MFGWNWNSFPVRPMNISIDAIAKSFQCNMNSSFIYMQMFSVFLFILLQFADGWRKMHTIWPFTNTDTAPRTVRCCNLIKMCQRGMAAKFLIKWKRCLVESYGSCVSFAWPIVVYANLHITLFVSGTAVHLHQKEEVSVGPFFFLCFLFQCMNVLFISMKRAIVHSGM